MDKPTIRWRRYLQKDPHFTEENIHEADEILDKYVRDITALRDTGNSVAMERAIHDVVLALNNYGGFSGKYPDLIESLERDELVEFIMCVAAECGYQRRAQDVTETWREW